MSKVTAFIPARCGSKSIPFKNIKPLAGRPLIYWNLAALEECEAVDAVIVATDCAEIRRVVREFSLSKVTLYDRSAETATDAASTESVMLEYLETNQLPDKDLFMLVQITSPLTRTEDYSSAIARIRAGEGDSLLTAVPFKRFLWTANGQAINYDFRSRPRRQDMKASYLENGAFYINSVGNIRRDRNRLSGRIVVQELHEYMATEIDEPHDWAVMETMIERYRK